MTIPKTADERTRWIPDPRWDALAGAGGSSTRGVWRAERAESTWIVKRLEPTGSQSEETRHHSWWRREAEVAISGILNGSRGLQPPAPISVDEDSAGITLWSPEVSTATITDDVLANALGRFNGQTADDPGWFNRDMLRHRVATTEGLGGLGPLRDSGMLDDSLLRTCDALWAVRDVILDGLDQLPQVLSHGDALPRNMLRPDGENVIACDWGQLGYNTVGADLATFCLYSAHDLCELIGPYCAGLRESELSVEDGIVRRATVQVAALIAASRASRAVVADNDIRSYVRRLVRAEPLLHESLAYP